MTIRELLAVALFGSLCLICSPVSASECTDYNWDIWKVAKALQQGLSKETLLMHLNGSIKELGVERVERIHELIDEVYRLPQTEAQPWFERHYKICTEDDEA